MNELMIPVLTHRVVSLEEAFKWSKFPTPPRSGPIPLSEVYSSPYFRGARGRLASFGRGLYYEKRARERRYR